MSAYPPSVGLAGRNQHLDRSLHSVGRPIFWRESQLSYTDRRIYNRRRFGTTFVDGGAMRIVRGIAFGLMLSLSLWLAATDNAQAQYPGLSCPGVWVASGGGNLCQCPDGSFANYVGTWPHGRTVCPQNVPQYTAPQGVACGGWTCPEGSYCSRMYGRCVPQDRVDCGSYHCAEGTSCARDSRYRACIATDEVDCGSYKCASDKKCSAAGCIPKEALACGTKGYCSDGLKCSRDGKRCLPSDVVDCGSFSCKTGAKCGSGNQCLVKDAVDCGKGKSCPAGHQCIKGGAECLTKQQIADRALAEKIAKEDAERQRRYEAEQRKAVQTAAALDRRFEAILKDPRQSATARQLAAIALGKDPVSLNLGNASGRQPKPRPLAATERELAKLALGKVRPTPAQKPSASFDDQLRAIANNPNESSAARQLARIALGGSSADSGRRNEDQAKDRRKHVIAVERIAKITGIAFERSSVASMQPAGQADKRDVSALPSPPQPPTQLPAVTGFNAPQPLPAAALKKKTNEVAYAIVTSLEIRRRGAIRRFDERHKMGLEYLKDNPQVQDAIHKIYALSAAYAVGGHVAFRATDIALNVQSGIDGCYKEMKSGDRYAATLKCINSTSSAITKIPGFPLPPGSGAVLNLSGAATTAYLYGFFFGL